MHRSPPALPAPQRKPTLIRSVELSSCINARPALVYGSVKPGTVHNCFPEMLILYVVLMIKSAQDEVEELTTGKGKDQGVTRMQARNESGGPGKALKRK